MDYEQFYDNPEENGTENHLDQSAYGLLEDLSTSRHTKPQINQDDATIKNEEEIEL